MSAAVRGGAGASQSALRLRACSANESATTTARVASGHAAASCVVDPSREAGVSAPLPRPVAVGRELDGRSGVTGLRHFESDIPVPATP